MTPLQSYLLVGVLILIAIGALAVICAVEYQHQARNQKRRDRWNAVLDEARK